MSQKLRVTRRLTVSMLTLAALSLVPSVTMAQTQTPITFTLSFLSLGREAPWWVALDKGYYKAAGMDVTIIPGQGTAQSLQALEAGTVQFAFSDVAALTLGHANGTSNAKLVAAIYQKSPYAIFSLKSGANVTDPKQLEGLEIGSGAGSFTPKVIEAFMKDRGLDPTKLKVTNVDGAARVSLLVTKKLPAIETFVMAQPSIERAAAPDEVKTFLLADHGLKLYSNGLVVRPDFAKANPELVKGFIKASLMGWRDAMRNPGEAGDIMMKYNKAVKREAVVEEMAIVGRLVATEETKAKGLGTIDPDTMKASVDLITKIVVSKNPVSFSNMYDTSFLPTPPVMP